LQKSAGELQKYFRSAGPRRKLVEHRFTLDQSSSIMQNFIFQNPTKIVFGSGQISSLSELIPASAPVLLIYGGGSIKQNGVHAQILQALANHRVTEFGGVEANPDFDTLMPAVKLAQRDPETFILAVGGGSVLDGAKFIAAAANYAGDPWQMLVDHGASVLSALPLGTVLTLPGTGSEANGASVISRRAIGEKLHFISPHVFPRFSILDPEVTMSLPTVQTANGIGDAFVHVLEQYLTYPVGAAIQDRFAESVLQVLIEEGAKVLASPQDYAARANVMWATTMALNGILAPGVPQDWASHMIGHELTALYGIDHARTLAVVVPNLLEVKKQEKWEKLLQYGERVWKIREGTETARVAETIAQTRAWFESLGIATQLNSYVPPANTAQTVADRLEQRGMTALGERGDITPPVVKQILELAA
jgi:NADP-dependent alcohol dehydrogenase